MHPKYVVPFGYSATSSPTRGHSPLSSSHHHQHHYSHSAAPSPSSYHPHSHHQHHHSASAVYFPQTPQHQHQVHIDQFGFAAFATSSPHHSLQQHSPQHTAHYHQYQQQHYQAAVAQPAELACDHYMEFHRRSQVSNSTNTTAAAASSSSDNEFDFVLLPSARNARRGMKTIVSNDTIPCKYGRSCFRKDCRFSHSQDELSEVLSAASSTPTSPAGPSSTSSSPLTVSSDSASDADSNSPTLNALRHSRTPSPVRRTAAFHAHTDFVSVQH